MGDNEALSFMACILAVFLMVVVSTVSSCSARYNEAAIEYYKVNSDAMGCDKLMRQ